MNKKVDEGHENSHNSQTTDIDLLINQQKVINERILRGRSLDSVRQSSKLSVSQKSVKTSSQKMFVFEKENYLLKIPYHVVVECILVYIETSVMQFEDVNPFHCFGYFKSDRFRHIWFLYRSISFGLDDKRHKRSMCYRKKKGFFFGNFVDVRKVENFNVVLIVRPEFEPTLYGKSIVIPKLRNIRKITLRGSKNKDKLMEKYCRMLFSSIDSLDSLILKRNFEFAQIHNLPDDLGEYINFPIKKIIADREFVRKDTMYTPLMEGFFQSKHSYGLTELVASKFDFSNCKKWTKMKNLKKLHLRRILFVELKPFMMQDLSNVEDLKIEQNPRLYFTNRFSDNEEDSPKFTSQDLLSSGINFKKIRKLFISSFSDIIFHRESFPNLRHLDYYYHGEMECKKWNTFPSIISLILNCKFVSDELFQNNNFDNLEKLRIISNRKVNQSMVLMSGKNWKKMSNLKNFYVRGYIFKDDFFQEQHLPKIESITVNVGRYNSLETCSNVLPKGKNWNPLKSLKTLSLSGSVTLPLEYEKDFFVGDKFLELEVLKLSYFTNNFRCFNIFDKLRKLDIFEVPIDDSFFQNGHLISHISIILNNLIKGIGWNVPNLTTLVLASCSKFEDHFFKKKRSNLKEVTLNSLSKVTGKDWTFIDNLEEFVVEECENFCDDFFQSEFFVNYYFSPNDLRIYLYCLKNITGKAWVILPYVFEAAVKIYKHDHEKFEPKEDASIFIRTHQCTNFLKVQGEGYEGSLNIKLRKDCKGLSIKKDGKFVHSDWYALGKLMEKNENIFWNETTNN